MYISQGDLKEISSLSKKFNITFEEAKSFYESEEGDYEEACIDIRYYLKEKNSKQA